MQRSLIILLVLDVIAAVALIVQVESLIEGTEVAAESLPPIIKQLAKPDTGSSDRRQEIADQQMSYVERSLASKRDYAQHVRVVVQLVALLLVVNAAFFWYVRQRWQTSMVSRTDLPQQR